MSRRSQEALRQRMAEEAARYMGEHGVRDYRLAKEKAAHHLSMPARAGWPSNREIEAALRARQSLFGGDDHKSRQRDLRQQAMQAMQMLSPFSPALTGAVLEGIAAPGNPVVLHVSATSPEAVELHLTEAGLTPRMGEKRYRFGAQDYRMCPCLGLDLAGTCYEIVVFSPGSQASPPLCPVSGKPMRRVNLGGLRALLDNAQPTNSITRGIEP